MLACGLLKSKAEQISQRRYQMKPIEDLKIEHEAVKITLRVLDSICNEAEKSGELANPDHLEQLLEFFTTFVDRCHHGKEEELLFPALEEVGVSREGGPIGVMLKEHQQGRDAVVKMKTALVRCQGGDPKAVGDLVYHARAYIALLDQHIDKENNVLFVLADNNLSKEKQTALWEGFERIETQKIGPGKHEAFHQMIESLESIYLS
jgi:hemerythrin-like domain-containing protein